MEKQLTILLVEDSPDDVFFFQRALKRTGLVAALHVAADGRQAIEYLTNEGPFADTTQYSRPALIFIDLKMPRMNGFELLEWIGRKFPQPPFRAIVLTSSDEPQDYQRALDLGAHGYYLKPVSVEQLSAAIQRLQPSDSAVRDT